MKRKQKVNKMETNEEFQLPFQLLVIGHSIGPMKQIGGTYAQFTFNTAMGQLFAFIERPTVNEIKAIESGKIVLGMTNVGDVFFLNFQFGNRDLTFEVPYHAQLELNKFEFQIPEEGKGYGIQIVLVDSTNGIIKAIRLIGTSKEWSDDFRNAFIGMKKEPFDRGVYDKAVQQVYSKYPIGKLISVGKIFDIKWKKVI
jgi:hypothetical protein